MVLPEEPGRRVKGFKLSCGLSRTNLWAWGKKGTFKFSVFQYKKKKYKSKFSQGYKPCEIFKEKGQQFYDRVQKQNNTYATGSVVCLLWLAK